MGWLTFFVFSIILFLLFIPLNKLKKSWYGGLIAMIMVYVIETTLINLDAFSYSSTNLKLGNLPIFYLLGAFFGGNILVHFCPQRKPMLFPYILLAGFLFLCLELIMYKSGNFTYLKWSPVNSYILNIFGFIIVIWLWNWVSEITCK